MAFNINEMRGQLTGGGARPNLFQVQLTNPINRGAEEKLSFMCKTASLPASTVSSVDVPYFGRVIKVAGQRTFADWSITIINDEDFIVRNAMEQWVNEIQLAQQNTTTRSANPNDYKSQGQIFQYGKEGNILRTYQFNGVFPTEVAAIEMGWDTNDTIEEFAVTLAYDWHNVLPGATGDAGGQ